MVVALVVAAAVLLVIATTAVAVASFCKPSHPGVTKKLKDIKLHERKNE